MVIAAPRAQAGWMKTMSRTEVVEALRGQLLAVSDDEHSICELAARRGIFCHGFAQWSFTELKARHPTIVRSRPRVTPKELRDLADRFQVARATARGTALACDTQMQEGALQICKGWDQWTSADLARFYWELAGEEIEVRAEGAVLPAP
jgi:hypothetical protein